MPFTAPIPEFDEVRLPHRIAWGFSGGPEFSTSIAETSAGFEQRNVDFEQPRRRWTAAHAFYEPDELVELQSFYLARRGRAVGFRFWDPLDFCTDQAAHMLNATGQMDVLHAQGTYTPELLVRVSDGAIGVGNGVATTYQLTKTYLAEPRVGRATHAGNPTFTFAAAGDTVTRSGGSWVTDGFAIGQRVFFAGTVSNDYAFTVTNVTALVLTTSDGLVNEVISNLSVFSNEGGGADLLRPLTKPVRHEGGTLAVRVYVNGTPLVEGVGFTIDTTTGVITFAVAPAAGSILDADALFDVPVRFDSDLFNAQPEAHAIGEWTNVELRELRL